MSDPHLPAEVLDHVVDHLHDNPETLKQCCLVSKSWITRTRTHLFADIGFPVPKSLRRWKETFPDPSSSPAHYAKTLHARCPELLTTADAEVGGLIREFSRVVHLEVGNSFVDPAYFVLFHGFSPVLKSLHVTVSVPSSLRIFNLILSFPLLEDLVVFVPIPWDDNDPEEDETPTTNQLSSPPIFTGSLELHHGKWTKPFTRRLLSLPGGIHFRKLTLTYMREEDASLVMALVWECSHSLESLEISGTRSSRSKSASINLSKATKLKDVTFLLNSWSVKWIIPTLQTLTPKHQDFRQIAIKISTIASSYVDLNLSWTIEEASYGQWLDLDRFLVQFWESRSIRPKIVSVAELRMGDHIQRFLPEVKRSGIFDLVEYSHV